MFQKGAWQGADNREAHIGRSSFKPRKQRPPLLLLPRPLRLTPLARRALSLRFKSRHSYSFSSPRRTDHLASRRSLAVPCRCVESLVVAAILLSPLLPQWPWFIVTRFICRRCATSPLPPSTRPLRPFVEPPHVNQISCSPAHRVLGRIVPPPSVPTSPRSIGFCANWDCISSSLGLC